MVNLKKNKSDLPIFLPVFLNKLSKEWHANVNNIFKTVKYVVD